MTKIIAFDVYGTLIDTQGISHHLKEMIGEQANSFAAQWRIKQLEYSFRRGLMNDYQPFSICTAQALDYTCLLFGIELSPLQKQSLLEAYRILPAFEEVTNCLATLKANGFALYALSNGEKMAVEMLLSHAGISDYFLKVFSVEPLKTFKPNPVVYQYFLEQVNAQGSEAWLISSNPFDVLGAMANGFKTAWIKRDPKAVFDPWGIAPTVTLKSLSELAENLI